MNAPGHLAFVTGPVRSGKSRRALEMVAPFGDSVVFVGTWMPDQGDPEMNARVQRHRGERPASWRTLEAPASVSESLQQLHPPPSAVLLDCLTLWLSARLELPDEAIVDAWDRELAGFRQARWPTVVVGNEVGWAPVPELPVLRRFRDLAGVLAQRTTAAAHEAWLMVAGCALRLK